MKKKFHKGFTLVELIVVLAIIAVLAGLLIPMMVGQITKSRIASANQGAATVRQVAEVFLTQADTAGYGIKANTVQVFKVRAYTGNDGKVHWECTAADPDKFNGTSSVSWGASGSYSGGANVADLTQGEDRICCAISQKLPSVKRASIVAYLSSAGCAYAVYTTETGEYLDESVYPEAVNGKAPLAYDWSNEDGGINADGSIIGTAPTVAKN